MPARCPHVYGMSRSPRSCVGPSSAPQQIHMPRAACAGAQWLQSWARHNSDNITTARRGVQASIIDERSARSIRRASFEEPVSCRRRMHTRMQARHELRRARKCGSYPAGLDKMENYTGCALMLDENRVSRQADASCRALSHLTRRSGDNAAKQRHSSGARSRTGPCMRDK